MGGRGAWALDGRDLRSWTVVILQGAPEYKGAPEYNHSLTIVKFLQYDK